MGNAERSGIGNDKKTTNLMLHQSLEYDQNKHTPDQQTGRDGQVALLLELTPAVKAILIRKYASVIASASSGSL